MKKVILVILLSYLSSLLASSFSECNYQLKILSINEENIQIELIKHLNNESSIKSCNRIIQSKEISKTKIFKGLGLIKPNTTLRAKRTIYSGMGAGGLVSHIKWEFTK